MIRTGAALPAWKPSLDVENSFKSGGYRHCKILGPARLVRLLSHAGQAPEGQMYESNRVERPFWFDEEDLVRIRSEAMADLKFQVGKNDWPEKSKTRLGMYLRHQLRDLLAVRRDWTPSFDYYVVLSVPIKEEVVALEGWVGSQPVYSDSFPGASAAKIRWRTEAVRHSIRYFVERESWRVD